MKKPHATLLRGVYCLPCSIENFGIVTQTVVGGFDSESNSLKNLRRLQFLKRKLLSRTNLTRPIIKNTEMFFTIGRNMALTRCLGDINNTQTTLVSLVTIFADTPDHGPVVTAILYPKPATYALHGRKRDDQKPPPSDSVHRYRTLSQFRKPADFLGEVHSTPPFFVMSVLAEIIK